MGLTDKLRAALDRDGNGRIELTDVKEGARQAGSAVRRALDSDGDGRLSLNDVNVFYADVLDKEVRRAARSWPHLLKQPAFWIAAIVGLLNAVNAYLYYSAQLPGYGGDIFGGVAFLLVLSGLFAWDYYHGANWLDGSRVMALIWAGIVFAGGVLAFAGQMTYESDVGRNQGNLQAVVTKTTQTAATADATRYQEIIDQADGKPPRAVETIRMDLDREGQNYFCSKRSSWCQVANYCPTRKSSKNCVEWARLSSELSIAIEYENISKRLADLATKAEQPAASSAAPTTETEVQAKTMAKFTGRSLEETRERMGIWQAMAIEAFIHFVMFLAVGRAHNEAHRWHEAVLAKRQAQMGAGSETVDTVADTSVAALTGKLQEMQKVVPANPVVEAARSGGEAIAQPRSSSEAIAHQRDDRPVNLNQLFKWREQGLVETMGAWLSLDDAYAAYEAWAVASGGHVASADKVHAEIGRHRLLVPVTHPETGEPGYGGMNIRAVAA